MQEFISSSLEQTLSIGEKLVKTLLPGTVIALKGDLGAGKTVFTKGIAKGLGIKDYRHVNSPTFVIIKEYQKGIMPLYHFDVYRLNDIEELETIGYKEYFYGDGISVVEWANKIEEALPDKRVDVYLEHVDEHTRKITIKK
ncbi:MAG: tRNA (adenosine(37)-N6)-threonylcarbamoyltransferase complex ATPase subunit type 1 TsaE [Candidatus Omnitrophica bacterium]|nr:tRNA (adenosine(37)-N6)-threonylcarbamoyltransferase complex ATPase subunit type 1 TsaE [Candidatus Omnitrophota bacterium]